MDRRMVLTICSEDEHSEAFAKVVKERYPSVIVSKVGGFGSPNLCYGVGCHVYQSNQAILDFLGRELGSMPVA